MSTGSRRPAFVKPPDSGAGEPPWLRQTLSELQNLLRLPPNWDSYGALPIDPRAAAVAHRLLLEIMQVETPVPSVAPLSDSGIQLDWHRRGLDVEVMISPEGRTSTWCRDRRTGAEWEAELDRDPPTLARFRKTIIELSQRPDPS